MRQQAAANPKGRQNVGPAVRPGLEFRFKTSAKGAAQSACQAFGPRTRILQSPALTGGAIFCRAFGPVNRTPPDVLAKCPNSMRQQAAANQGASKLAHSKTLGVRASEIGA